MVTLTSLISAQQILFFLRQFSCLHALLEPTRLFILGGNSYLHDYSNLHAYFLGGKTPTYMIIRSSTKLSLLTPLACLQTSSALKGCANYYIIVKFETIAGQIKHFLRDWWKMSALPDLILPTRLFHFENLSYLHGY